MEPEIKYLIYIAGQRFLSSPEQQKLLKYLKSIPESEAYEIIKDMLNTKSNITLSTVKSVLNQKEYVTKLFKYGLLQSNAQSIKLWLEFAIPKLGIKSTLSVVEELDNETNQLIDIVLYWLPVFVPQNSTKYLKLIEKWQTKVKDREYQLDSK